MDVLDDGGNCVGVVVAEEGADEWGCGVIDGNDAERIAIEQTTIGEVHRGRETR